MKLIAPILILLFLSFTTSFRLRQDIVDPQTVEEGAAILQDAFEHTLEMVNESTANNNRNWEAVLDGEQGGSSYMYTQPGYAMTHSNDGINDDVATDAPATRIQN
mmetsp:Transcript_14868/g.16572  ORF Transcript_14868/g.16572 Transcript_14868/m.16572 type:complete len:105 (-) Transcript_14868:52-366(-)|eukprot:CAMPEP_0205804366 /NCGR_PEP_ID=MMETSP0205-20121125/7268_1 /ASSEMBLY_ACC=CAM_ASM_000278 /TAXON_ID=36767 /ORGANISM="Euplotes focardii, Strain TN1" /LENGTH=104 /DNA_ID=CAMNT_0053073869 /DNA_START=8 /DNA_END=322 /DNA_ORIENTATION=-